MVDTRSIRVLRESALNGRSFGHNAAECYSHSVGAPN